MARRGDSRVVNECLYEYGSVTNSDSVFLGYIFYIIGICGAPFDAIVGAYWYTAMPRTTERSFDALGSCIPPYLTRGFHIVLWETP